MLLLSQEAHDVRRGGRPHVHFHGRAGAGGDLVGYRQWKRANGFFDVERYTRSSAASLTVDLDGQPADPEWPAVDVIVGNPPFLGESKRDEWLSQVFDAYGWPPDRSDVEMVARLLALNLDWA